MNKYDRTYTEEIVFRCFVVFLFTSAFILYLLLFITCKSTKYYYRNGFTCEYCNTTYDTYSDYCQNCGKSMEDCYLKCTEFCFNCNKLAEDEKYCSNCGEEITENIKRWSEFSKRRQWNINFFADLHAK